jgi:uncharacterized membrane protein YagU involved in acid resistance
MSSVPPAAVPPDRPDAVLAHAAAGALAGLAATTAMTAFMTTLHGAPPWDGRKVLPPRQIAMRLAERADAHPERWREPSRESVSAVAHFGYGSSAGALYGLASASAHDHVLGRGVLFGLALWAVSYAGWLPLLDVHHPTRDQPRRVEAMVMAGHVVYGATLGLTRDMLRRSFGTRF